MNSSMIGSLSLGSSNSAAPVEAMSFAQTPQNNAWFNIYGDTSDRSASTTKLAFDGSNRGLTIGTPVAISDTLNLDLVFNASNANLDIGSAKEQQITARSLITLVQSCVTLRPLLVGQWMPLALWVATLTMANAR